MTDEARFQESPATYTGVQFAETFSTMVLSGVDATKANYLKVYANTPEAMNVLIPTGVAWVMGMWYKNSAVITQTIEAADGTNPRYDRVVLRCTRTGTIDVAPYVIKGTAAASPAIPALTQYEDVWDIPLALILVDAGATSIAAGKITDDRIGLASAELSYTIDEGGATVTTGSKRGLTVPWPCEIIGWEILGDPSGSAVVDVKAGTYSAYPTVASICAANKPTLSSATKGRNLAPSTWTTALKQYDKLVFNVDSCTTCTWLQINLFVVRTAVMA